MALPQKLLVVVVALGASLVILYAVAYSNVVDRDAEAVSDLPPYGDELRRLPPYEDYPSKEDQHLRALEQYSGPGWYPRHSPDGSRVAVTMSLGDDVPALRPLMLTPGWFLLSLVLDRPFIHTVAVFDTSAGRLRRVVSIMEMDPHSGIAHLYAWSGDSKALLIFGSGRLPENYDRPLELCLVYLPINDSLYRLSNCPPAWQRGRP